MKHNITFLIPLLLVASTICTSYMVYFEHDELTSGNIRRDEQVNLQLDITRLQNVLYNLITERDKNIDEARLNLSVTAMKTSIKTLLLVGDDDEVILANRYSWEQQKAAEISGYINKLGHEVKTRNNSHVFFDDSDDALLKGYYPVVLQLESKGNLPIKRMGVLYVESSITSQLVHARNDAIRHSLILMGVMLTVTFVIALLLHFVVSLRLKRLTVATRRLASGDLNASAALGGNDELTVVGKAFDDMAKRIEQDIHRREQAEDDLQELNKMLEQRIEERTSELELKKQELLDSQARAHHANKMTALGEMASGIAHEINSPLQVVSILTYKLRKNIIASGNKDIEELADKINLATKQITNIVESLRKMSRDSSSDPFEMVKISDIIEDATGITIERYKLKGIAFTINCHGECEKISLKCQRLQISQIIINLLNNAYDAVQTLTDKWIDLDVSDTDNSIVITVTDSGTGIQQDYQAKIFEPMFTTKDIGKGTGLGLSISSEIARNHDGILKLDTESEHTRFMLVLPKFGDNINNG